MLVYRVPAAGETPSDEEPMHELRREVFEKNLVAEGLEIEVDSVEDVPLRLLLLRFELYYPMTIINDKGLIMKLQTLKFSP